MSNKWPIVSIVVGGVLIGGSLLLKYLVKDKDVLDQKIENAEEYFDEFEDDIEYDSHDVKKLTDHFELIDISDKKPSIDELMTLYTGDKDGDEVVDSPFDIEEEVTNSMRDLPPFVISVDSFMNDYLSFSKNTLTYFEKDDILADDRDEVIVDYVSYIGNDAIDSFGEGSDDPNLVYVRNFSKEADYEIIKDPTAYQETVLGFDDPYDTASKYFNLDDREE